LSAFATAASRPTAEFPAAVRRTPMPAPTNRTSLTPQELDDLLAKLKEVMSEAERLRDNVGRQLSEERNRLQQRLSPISPSRRARKRR
jgi:glycine cleavage system protein P-like pyridoxal-binding family